MIHVIPLNDSEEHFLDIECSCLPRLTSRYNDIIVIHKAFDARDVIEQAEKIITSAGDIDE